MLVLVPPSTRCPSSSRRRRSILRTSRIPTFLNGDGRTSSPAFHNPSFQTNQVIPSKRAREESIDASPRQAPGGLPGSRSQTPGQGPYPGYGQPNGAGPMSNAPAHFQHLQTSSNPQPSPTVQQMNFNHGGGLKGSLPRRRVRSLLSKVVTMSRLDLQIMPVESGPPMTVSKALWETWGIPHSGLVSISLNSTPTWPTAWPKWA